MEKRRFRAAREQRRAVFEVAAAYTVFRKHSVLPADETAPNKFSGRQWALLQGSQASIGLTAEPNVNADQPPLLLFQAAAHEMAHQTGIASENEAELVGYLDCLNTSDPNIRYSGLAYALIVAGNALYDADSTRYLSVTETYGDAIWRDFTAYNDYWDAFSGEVRESADRRNDAYLKHNSQQSGIKSYGEAVISCMRNKRNKAIETRKKPTGNRHKIGNSIQPNNQFRKHK
jgi:hypothetical protein